MKVKGYWLIIVAVLAGTLGALLFKGCDKPKEVVRYLSVNLDSLKQTIAPDTIQVPVEKQITRIVKVPVLLSDTALVDSLLTQFYAQKSYYEELIHRLQNDDKDFGWNWDESVELDTRETVYEDSVSAKNYYHWWRITAEGPIKSYQYKVVPYCPAVSIPEAKQAKTHRAGFLIGGQFAGNSIRPIYGAQYQYKFLNASAGYIPKADADKAAFQIMLGATVGIK